MMRKLAVIFPGIGYTADRPLLHFSKMIAADLGYEIKPLPYTGFPPGVRGDRQKMEACYHIAMSQSREMLSEIDMDVYHDILFIGKSVGTIVAATLAAESPARERIRQVIYTPLDDTFSFPIRNAVVFTGSDDPWVGGSASRISALCTEQGIPCCLIPGGNHSLESGHWKEDLENLRMILLETERFIVQQKDLVSPWSSSRPKQYDSGLSKQ